jgi:hypothetical protein
MSDTGPSLVQIVPQRVFYAALISPIAIDAPMEQFNSSKFYYLVYKRHTQTFNLFTRIPSQRRSPMYNSLLDFSPLFIPAKNFSKYII